MSSANRLTERPQRLSRRATPALSLAEIAERKIDVPGPPKRDRFPTDWQEQAACGGQQHLFYGQTFDRQENTATKRTREARAKEVCAVCPVTEACLEYARSHGERYGVWGGKSFEGRQR